MCDKFFISREKINCLFILFLSSLSSPSSSPHEIITKESIFHFLSILKDSNYYLRFFFFFPNCQSTQNNSERWKIFNVTLILVFHSFKFFFREIQRNQIFFFSTFFTRLFVIKVLRGREKTCKPWH